MCAPLSSPLLPSPNCPRPRLPSLGRMKWSRLGTKSTATHRLYCPWPKQRRTDQGISTVSQCICARSSSAVVWGSCRKEAFCFYAGSPCRPHIAPHVMALHCAVWYCALPHRALGDDPVAEKRTALSEVCSMVRDGLSMVWINRKFTSKCSVSLEVFNWHEIPERGICYGITVLICW